MTSIDDSQTNDEAQAEEPKLADRGWYFPTLGQTVSAPTYDEALKLATAQKKEEDGDGRS